ncbi:MAG TPA: hypothetical protein VMF06_19770 [Candidatus Limnocylindria bacterium]|nr:hypothetical protein [Candidatus Limnocylindria bacterium]
MMEHLSVLFALLLLCPAILAGQSNERAPARPTTVTTLDPPEAGFFSKRIDYRGIPIKAHLVVTNEALFAAYDRLDLLLGHLPMAVSNLVAAGAELHIIGRDQVTSDLPEHQHLKGRKLDYYNGLTVDQRTRGLGGLLTSCGEENLLKLDQDRYRGRDICLHEFSHNVRNQGIPREVRDRFDAQLRQSLDRGLWVKSYAGSNPDEFFAELTMWYFGTHGDLGMTGVKPENGPEGLKKYDPEAYILFDDFYQGRIPVGPVTPRQRRSGAMTNAPSSSVIQKKDGEKQ